MTHVTQMHQWLKSVWVHLCEFKASARHQLWKSAYFPCNVYAHVPCTRSIKLTYHRRLHLHILFYWSCPTGVSVIIPSTRFFIHVFTYFALSSSLGGKLRLPCTFMFCIIFSLYPQSTAESCHFVFSLYSIFSSFLSSFISSIIFLVSCLLTTYISF